MGDEDRIIRYQAAKPLTHTCRLAHMRSHIVTSPGTACRRRWRGRRYGSASRHSILSPCLRLCRPRPSRPGEVSLLMRRAHIMCHPALVAIGRSFSSSRNVQRHGIDRASCPHDPAARRRSGIVPSRYSPSTSRTAAGRSSSSRRARAPIRAWERLGRINCFAATNASSSTLRGRVHHHCVHDS